MRAGHLAAGHDEPAPRGLRTQHGHELQHPVVADPRTRLVRGLQRRQAPSARLVVHSPAVRPARVVRVCGRGEQDEAVRVRDRRNRVAPREAAAGVRAAPGVDPLRRRGRRASVRLPQQDLDVTADDVARTAVRGERVVAQHQVDRTDPASRPGCERDAVGVPLLGHAPPGPVLVPGCDREAVAVDGRATAGDAVRQPAAVVEHHVRADRQGRPRRPQRRLVIGVERPVQFGVRRHQEGLAGPDPRGGARLDQPDALDAVRGAIGEGEHLAPEHSCSGARRRWIQRARFGRDGCSHRTMITP